MNETRDQAQRALILATRVIIEHTRRLRADFVVVGELVGNRRDPSLLHARHVVVPQVDALIGIFPVRNPAEVGRVNVGRDAILETVQLIRPNEMHLPREATAIPHQAQVMGKGGHGRGHIGRVVVTTAPSAASRSMCGLLTSAL